MHTNRRNWLKRVGLGLAGLSLGPLEALALPGRNDFLDAESDNDEIDLSHNENPYGPSALAIAAMRKNANISNRYNWELTGELISAIAKKNNVTADNILLGAGSTEIIDLMVQYFAFKKGSFVLADPTYNSWAKTAENLGLKKILVPLTADKKHDLPAMLAAIEPDTKFVYICNPNNPTGTVCEREALINFIKEATKEATVLVDEAYLDYSGQTSISNLVNENKNLIVVRTFSKIYGLAGARIGYAVGHTETINEISQLQTWAGGGVSVVSRVGAMASLKDEAFVRECYLLNEKTRKYTVEQMELLGISCSPSHTNFIYFSLEKYKKDFFNQLKIHNIVGTGIYEESGKWTRITVGTMKEMKKLIDAIK